MQFGLKGIWLKCLKIRLNSWERPRTGLILKQNFVFFVDNSGADPVFFPINPYHTNGSQKWNSPM